MIKRMLIATVIALSASAQAMASNTTYNIFLIPAQQVNSVVGTLNNHLKKDELNSLYNQGFLPHITLYLTEYPEGSLSKLKKAAQKLASQWHSFDLSLNKINRTKGNWLMLNVANSPQLQRLADETTLAMGPLRALDPTLPGWVSHYPNKLASFKRYGSPNVFANFQPHITLLPESDAAKLDRFMLSYGNAYKSVTLKVRGIGIAKVNANGQAKHEIATYLFKK